jgi:hypothetical protein
MSEKVTFSAFDPMRFDAPSHCDVCTSNPPVFHYEYSLDEGARLSPKRGFCCSFCAAHLLEKLRNAESQVWAEEEASLKADDLDVADLEERRLATFGSAGRS